MSKINLLPPEIKEQYEFAKKNRSIFSWITSLFFVMVVFTGFSYYGYLFLKEKLEAAESEVSKKEQTIREDKDIEKDAKNLSDRLQVYKKIDKERIYWSKAIEEIANRTPSNLYLINIKATDDTKIRGSITGSAVDKVAIGSFIDSLKETGIFKFIDIESVTVTNDQATKKEGNTFVLSFTIDVEKLK